MDKDTLSPYIGVVFNNATRWNSDYRIIRCAWKLRKYIDYYVSETINYPEPAKRIPKEDQFNNDDWGVLAAIIKVMAPFEDLTKKFEIRGPLFSIIIPNLIRLIQKLQGIRIKFRGDIAFEPFEGLDILEFNICVAPAIPIPKSTRRTRNRAPPLERAPLPELVVASSQIGSQDLPMEILDSQPLPPPRSRPSRTSTATSFQATTATASFSSFILLEDTPPINYANDLSNEGMEAVGYILDKVINKLK